MPAIGQIKIRYIPRKGGNPHLMRDMWVRCPNCGKERWIEKRYMERHNTGGICQSCSAKRTRERMHSIPVEERRILRQSDGYCYVHLPLNHWCVPMSGKKSTSRIIFIHRLVMAEHIGRLLTQKEVVHHINGIRDDNRIENLQLVSRGQHKMSYQQGYMQGYKDGLVARSEYSEN